MRVGLLGGSFDPVHKGHIKLAQSALSQLKLKKVYFVLAPRPPHKSPQMVAPAKDRLKMLRLALKGAKKLSAATWELKRKGPSYTVTTLQNLKRLHPREEIFFIMGSDTFRGFQTWRNPEEILRLARIAVGRRPGSEKFAVKESWRSRVVRLRGKFPQFSSREVRQNRLNLRLLRKVLPRSVAEFIRNTGLYRYAHQ
jgi:nicotinate-nucleotide adenylyltransferase